MPERLHDRRWLIAEGAAQRAGCVVRTLRDPQEAHVAERLLADVWETNKIPINATMLIALAHTGNYVAGAFAVDEPSRMVGACVGFFAAPTAQTLHSQIAGVVPSAAGRGIGAAMKQHERAWCLDIGVTTMTWTYDPVIARNAHFNLTRLGATLKEYVVDFYGPMLDGLNAGDTSDRVLVAWDLLAEQRPPVGTLPRASPLVTVGAGGRPVLHAVEDDSAAVIIEVPRDIEQLRRDDPAAARDWREVTRNTLGPLLRAPDWEPAGFDQGAYVFRKGAR